MKTNFLFIALTLGVGVIGAGAQGTAFTYQGRLNDGANPATGIYDLRFAIYDSTNNPGVLIAGPLTNAAASVSNGLFTAALDFGDGVFDGTPRFLEIAVRTNGGVSFVPLTPRQPLTATPYAIFANSASNLVGALSPSQISGTYNKPVNFNNGADSFSGTFLGQFFGSTFTGGNFTGNFLGTGSGLYDVWHTGGNSGTTPASFLGTTDNQALVLKVNGQEAMRFAPTTDTPDVIGGWGGNYVQPDLLGVTIGGGGSAIFFLGQAQPNAVTNNGNYAVIAGGYNNMVTNYGGTILGGSVNLSGGNFATILGGQFHTNLGNYGVIAGGYNNVIGLNGFYSSIGGGFGNSNMMSDSVIGGGAYNVVTTNIGNGGYQPVYSTIGGGENNVADGGWTAIAGGYFNTNRGVSGFIGSGDFNIINGSYSAIGGGAYNEVAGIGSFIGGGGFDGFSIQGNKADAGGSSIVGGVANVIYFTAADSFIGGGFGNSIQTNSGDSVVGGGVNNSIGSGSGYATIPGGGDNAIQSNSFSSTIAGGYGNTIESFNSTIGGGFTNTIYTNSPDATIAGGSFNFIGPSAALATISGGTGNSNSASYGVIGGGLANINTGSSSFIGGGIANTTSGGLSTSVGGQGNAALNNNTTIVGGLFNTNYGVLAFIGGGDNNLAFGWASVISGGESNRAFGQFSMAAGYHAGALSDGSFVWSDFQPANFGSTSSNQFLIRAQNGVGINTNNPQAALHVVGSIIADNFLGSGSSLSGLNFSQLGGTVPNAALSGTYGNVLTFNNAANSFSGNGAGLTSLNANNISSGTLSDARLSSDVALTDRSQTFIGTNSFLTGLSTGSRLLVTGTTGIDTNRFTGLGFQYYTGTGEGAIMSSFDDGFASIAFYTKAGGGLPVTKRMVIDTTGNVGIGVNSPGARFQVVNATCDGNNWVNSSDRNLKENFAPVEPLSVLARVATLPIQKWNYKSDPAQTHLGPVAQDFRAAFELGPDDKHIATVDEGGVALAAIQGLNQKLEEQRGELKQKETEIAGLKERLDKLEQLVSRRNKQAK